MKRKLFWILLLLSVFVACRNEKDMEELALNEELTMKTGDIFQSTTGKLSVKVTKITDSRCPTGVVCVWQGEATVYLDVNESKTYEVVLSTFHQPVDTVNNYIFKLINVLPYPVYQVEVPDSDKKVILQIEKLQ